VGGSDTQTGDVPDEWVAARVSLGLVEVWAVCVAR
jgi:hypothetical protein